MKTVTVKLEEDLLDLLDRYAAKNKLNRSEAVRKAIESMVKKDLEEEVIPTVRVERIRL